MAGASTQTAVTFEATSRKARLQYLLYLPKGYGEDESRRWPLVLFLHGAAERGENLQSLKRAGLPKLLVGRDDFPSIVVSPQCRLGEWWPNQVSTLIALLDDVTARYAVDLDRVYLTGLSMGGSGSWALASADPERFAAIVPICGGGTQDMVARIKHVPVWAFHGAKDDVVPLFRSKAMVEALESAGGNARLTVYPDAAHDSWTRTYDNPEVFAWLFNQRRNT